MYKKDLNPRTKILPDPSTLHKLYLSLISKFLRIFILRSFEYRATR